ncbi:TonB-dependent receptor plug domain-containing protein [Pyxidicoccus trucidator]|uniref:TonB-dependent receptor plug domain-containing protein n=1 Tax=Pyxidicoccus trucidator TaxID=2709662 RepID=UPI0013DA1B86|nr:TonB-dependent receptor [Pyxidicoccus trucidator]
MRGAFRFAGARVLVLGLCLGPVASARASDVTEYVAVNRPAPDGSAVRSSERLAESVPGVQLDVNGPAIHGATAFENSYLLDGLSTNDSTTGANALPLSTEFLSSLNFITSGYMAEYGRATGGIIEADLRVEPSERLQGSIFGYWVPGALAASDVSGRGPLRHLGDFGATLGGSLVRHRLSFFAGVAPALGRVEQTRTFQGASRTSFADQRTLQAVAKLRYAVNLDHELFLSFITTPGFSRGDGRPTSEDVSPESEAPRELDSNASSVRLTYAGGFLDKRLLLNLRAGWQWQRVSPGDEGAGLEPGSVRAQDQLQANARLTYLMSWAGYHVFKTGVEAERVTTELSSTASRQVLAGYVQDSWSFSNRFTLNAGLRYEAQSLEAGEGEGTLRLGGALLPRLGLVLDPLANGRTRMFAHVAKYQSLVSPALLTSPVRSVTVDPALVPPSSRELVVGIEYELLSQVRTGASYTGRRLDSALQYLPHGEGTEVLLGNPGEGLASGTPKAERAYDAVTLWLDGNFGEEWLSRLSYTASRLRGNSPGLQPLAGAPGLAVDTTPAELSDTRTVLPADRTHTVKAYLSRDFSLTRRLNTNLGLSYLGASGTPREEGGRTSWAHTLDVHLGAGYWLAPGSRLEFSLDVFNLLDVQEDARWDGSTPLRLQAPRQVRLGARYLFF